MIIGLSGKKQSGKSTITQHLVQNHGFTEISWAEPLKSIIGIDLLGLSLQQVYGSNKDKETIDPFWEKSPRELLQIIGTECFRKQVHPDFWVKLGIRKAKEYQLGTISQTVFSDCRFPNEVEAIKKENGIIIRVIREDWNVVDEHESETALDNYPFEHIVTAKTGELDSLKLQVELILSRYAV